MSRDLRIDFIRGVVLLLIVADHVLNNERSWLALGGGGFFIDAGPVFVFMSGLVCGMVYSRTVEKQGFLATQKKSLRRCAQLYVAQLMMLASVLGLVYVARHFETVNIGQFGLDKLIEHPAASLPRVLGLSYLPWLMDILVFYMVLLAALPAMLWIYRRNRAIAVGISLALYLLAQAKPEFSPIEYGSGKPWFWNPLGWQLLFFGGVWIGVERKSGRLRLPRNRWLTAATVLGLAGVVAFKTAHLHLSDSYHVVDRQRMAPLRVLNLLLIAYLAASVLRSHWPIWRSAWLRPIVRCGQHSLEIFCIGVVIDYAVSLVLLALTNPAAEALVVGGGVALTLLAAWGLDRWSQRGKAAEAVPAMPTAASASAAIATPLSLAAAPAIMLVAAPTLGQPSAGGRNAADTALARGTTWPAAGWRHQPAESFDRPLEGIEPISEGCEPVQGPADLVDAAMPAS